MAYTPQIRAKLKRAPSSLGVQLGRAAIALDFPVTDVARATGASRMTVYNWYSGREVTNAYRRHVQTLITILKNSSDAEEARSRAWKTFDPAR